MDRQTEITVAMLKCLIDDLEVGRVQVLDRQGEATGNIMKLSMVLQGSPSLLPQIGEVRGYA